MYQGINDRNIHPREKFCLLHIGCNQLKVFTTKESLHCHLYLTLMASEYLSDGHGVELAVSANFKNSKSPVSKAQIETKIKKPFYVALFEVLL